MVQGGRENDFFVCREGSKQTDPATVQGQQPFAFAWGSDVAEQRIKCL